MERAYAVAHSFMLRRPREAAPTESCCREDRLWWLVTGYHEGRSWGRMEGSLRLRARMKASSVRLEERNGGVSMLVTPRVYLKHIATTIGFAEPR